MHFYTVDLFFLLTFIVTLLVNQTNIGCVRGVRTYLQHSAGYHLYLIWTKQKDLKKTQNSGTMIHKIATMNKYNHKSQNKRSIDAHRSLLRCVTCQRFLNMVIKPMPSVFAFNCSNCCGTLGIISDVLHNKKMLPFIPGIDSSA